MWNTTRSNGVDEEDIMKNPSGLKLMQKLCILLHVTQPEFGSNDKATEFKVDYEPFKSLHSLLISNMNVDATVKSEVESRVAYVPWNPKEQFTSVVSIYFILILP